MRFFALVAILFLLSLAIELEAADESNKRPVILAIFAHADDESVVAPLLASYAREGARVYLAIATDGRIRCNRARRDSSR